MRLNAVYELISFCRQEANTGKASAIFVVRRPLTVITERSEED